MLLAAALWFVSGAIAYVAGYGMIGNALMGFGIVAGWVLADGPDDLTEREELA